MNPHRSRFSLHPLLQLALAFATGICAASYLQIRVMIALVFGAVCSIVSVVFVIKKRIAMAGLRLLIAFFFVGQALAVLEKQSSGKATSEFA